MPVKSGITVGVCLLVNWSKLGLKKIKNSLALLFLDVVQTTTC